MILIDKIEVEVYGRLVKHYELLGYNIPKRKNRHGKLTVAKGTKVIVKVEDIPLNSHIEIPYQCDYCDEKGLKVFSLLNRGRKLVPKDCCEQCTPLKKRDINLLKYGVEHAMQLESTKRKLRETNLKIRGVEYPTQSPEVKEKVVNSYLDKYGETNPMKNEEIKNKLKEIMIDKYGSPYPNQNEEIKNKTLQTFRNKYGVDNPQQNKKIKEKTMKTMNKNGNIPWSIPQKYIHNLIGGELNYLFGTSAIDIAFIDEKIYVEYDGGGHWLRVTHGRMTDKEFEIKEIKRSYALQSRGWKEIRIISRRDKLPSDERLIEMMQYARDYLNTGRHYIKFDIDNGIVATSQFEKEYSFGKLRKVKQQDLLNEHNSRKFTPTQQ